ncbi:hypothetical protein QBC38DRAFT_462171 [Podospora fimiseda]|uniref:Uncharacterized protein n=1 Tax=Podospora fimiseda TaxID=252190 RepID=A0AAN7BEH1_9PEZI|nr:hypothetical protein QBC38DRAFT_462171 [Podospora fimiseda]
MPKELVPNTRAQARLRRLSALNLELPLNTLLPPPVAIRYSAGIRRVSSMWSLRNCSVIAICVGLSEVRGAGKERAGLYGVVKLRISVYHKPVSPPILGEYEERLGGTEGNTPSGTCNVPDICSNGELIPLAYSSIGIWMMVETKRDKSHRKQRRFWGKSYLVAMAVIARRVIFLSSNNIPGGVKLVVKTCEAFRSRQYDATR